MKNKVTINSDQMHYLSLAQMATDMRTILDQYNYSYTDSHIKKYASNISRELTKLEMRADKLHGIVIEWDK